MSTTWSLKSGSLLYIISQYMRVVIIFEYFLFSFWLMKYKFIYFTLKFLIYTPLYVNNYFSQSIFFFFNFWNGKKFEFFQRNQEFLKMYWLLLEICILFRLFVSKYLCIKWKLQDSLPFYINLAQLTIS